MKRQPDSDTGGFTADCGPRAIHRDPRITAGPTGLTVGRRIPSGHRLGNYVTVDNRLPPTTVPDGEAMIYANGKIDFAAAQS